MPKNDARVSMGQMAVISRTGQPLHEVDPCEWVDTLVDVCHAYAAEGCPDSCYPDPVALLRGALVHVEAEL